MSNEVLIVEDSKQKARAIRECLLNFSSDIAITETDTIAVAGQLIEQNSWDGIVLDLAFHRTQQNVDMLDRPYLAGLEILQQLNEMRLKVPVIVATQHDSFVNTKYGTFSSSSELSEVLANVFPRNFRGLVEVRLGETRWLNELGQLALEHFV